MKNKNMEASPSASPSSVSWSMVGSSTWSPSSSVPSGLSPGGTQSVKTPISSPSSGDARRPNSRRKQERHRQQKSKPKQKQQSNPVVSDDEEDPTIKVPEKDKETLPHQQQHPRRVKDLYDDGYYRDNSLSKQEAINPKDFGGIIIEHQAQRLSAHLRRLTNEEIGVTTMQVNININTCQFHNDMHAPSVSLFFLVKAYINLFYLRSLYFHHSATSRRYLFFFLFKFCLSRSLFRST